MDEERVEVGEVEVRTITCRVFVTVDMGRFVGVTPRGSETVRCRDYDACIDELKALVSREKVRVSIPFVTPGFARAMATGIHAGNGSVLYDSEGSRGLQLEAGYRRGGAYKAMTDEELAEGRRLRDAVTEANRAFDAWVSAHEWTKFGKVVDDAVQEAAAKREPVEA